MQRFSLNFICVLSSHREGAIKFDILFKCFRFQRLVCSFSLSHHPTHAPISVPSVPRYIYTSSPGPPTAQSVQAVKLLDQNVIWTGIACPDGDKRGKTLQTPASQPTVVRRREPHHCVQQRFTSCALSGHATASRPERLAPKVVCWAPFRSVFPRLLRYSFFVIISLTKGDNRADSTEAKATEHSMVHGPEEWKKPSMTLTCLNCNRSSRSAKRELPSICSHRPTERTPACGRTAT